MNVRRTVAVVTVTAAAFSGATLLAPAAEASGGGGTRVIKSGSCSGSADWKLKAKHDDGRLEVEFEVDSNRTGQSWAVRITDNGHQVFSGRRTTHGRSGSFARAAARQPRRHRRHPRRARTPARPAPAPSASDARASTCSSGRPGRGLRRTTARSASVRVLSSHATTPVTFG